MKPAARVRCFMSQWPGPRPFSGNGIDHFVMAITAARRDVGDGELHRIVRTIIKDNCLFDPPDLDGRMPRVSKWER